MSASIRPAVTSSVLLAVIATTAAGYQAADQRQTGAAAFTVSTEAIAQANELADAQIEDTARLAADRNDTNASIAAAQEKDRSRRDRRGPGRRQGPPRGRRRRSPATRPARRSRPRSRPSSPTPRATPAPPPGRCSPEFGFDDSQWSCLDSLWMGESGWSYKAENSSSGAYGIPQSLPGSKMATVGLRLADQPGHPDPLGPAVHQELLRHPVWRLERVAEPLPALVLSRTPRRRDAAPVLPVRQPVGVGCRWPQLSGAGGSWRARRGPRRAAPR